jgi:hypothetical protein
VNFQAGMQQPGILQPAEADSQSIGRRRFTEMRAVAGLYRYTQSISRRLSPARPPQSLNRLQSEAAARKFCRQIWLGKDPAHDPAPLKAGAGLIDLRRCGCGRLTVSSLALALADDPSENSDKSLKSFPWMIDPLLCCGGRKAAGAAAELQIVRPWLHGWAHHS